MTYARSRPNDIVPLAEKHDIGVMGNAAHRWSSSKNQFKPMWLYECPHIIDSSGYNVLASWVRERTDVTGEIKAQHTKNAIENDPKGYEQEINSECPFYPWSVSQYHEWLSNYDHEFEWAACMDYACESQFDPLLSVEQRVKLTIKNTIKHFGFEPGYDLLPVLQGRSIQKYIECFNEYCSNNIPVGELGLGTVCRISSSDEIVKTEESIRKHCKGVKKLHGFGVKINAYKKGAGFESADSQAWAYPSSNGKCYVQNGEGLTSVPMSDNSRLRTVWSFANYYDYVTKLNDNFPEPNIDMVLCNLVDGSKAGTKQNSQYSPMRIEDIGGFIEISGQAHAYAKQKYPDIPTPLAIAILLYTEGEFAGLS